MPAIVANAATEACLRAILTNEGYSLNRHRAHGETGADIITERSGSTIHIEVIGYKSSGAARAKDFYESFFRAVSRLNDGADCCVIALPHLFAQGLPARAGQHDVAWKRIAHAFPELGIWLVNVDEQTYARTTWIEWSN